MFQFDWQSLLKYLLEGLGVALAAFYIPPKNLNIQEIVLIALTAAATFAVLDMFSPGVAEVLDKDYRFRYRSSGQWYQHCWLRHP